MSADDDVCRGCNYTKRSDDPDFIRGLCVRAHHEGDPSCWSRAGHPKPLKPGEHDTCEHCAEPLRERVGHGGRYRWERLDTPDTAILGSGSECPKNERGHEPA